MYLKIDQKVRKGSVRCVRFCAAPNLKMPGAIATMWDTGRGPSTLRSLKLGIQESLQVLYSLFLHFSIENVYVFSFISEIFETV